MPRGNSSTFLSAPTTDLEKNETLTTSLASGNYLVHVQGKIGPTDCWQRDDTLVVPPPGKPLIRTLGLVHVNSPSC